MAAIIIHPTQGKHVSSFQATAYHAARKVYKSKAAVFGTKLTGGSVSFHLDKYATPGKDSRVGDFWDEVAKCTTFVYVGHSGTDDGPILAYEDDALYTEAANYSQPWTTKTGDTSTLDTAGNAFWSKVGTSRTNIVKIIIIGCTSGHTYGGAVAKAAKCDVYGPIDSIAAGNPSTIVPILSDIQKGKSGGLKRW